MYFNYELFGYLHRKNRLDYNLKINSFELNSTKKSRSLGLGSKRLEDQWFSMEFQYLSMVCDAFLIGFYGVSIVFDAFSIDFYCFSMDILNSFLSYF